MTYDVESFLADLETHLKTNLNTKITAINAEKADSVVLRSVDNAAYLFQTMDDTVANYDPYVYYGIQDIESQGNGAQTLNRFTVIVAIIIHDAAGDILVGKRMLRYSRVLSEVMEDRYSSIGSEYKKTKISSLVPITFRLLDDSNNYRAIGIELEIILG